MENKVLKKIILSVMFYFFTILTAGAASNSSSISIDIGSDEQGNKNTAVAVDLSLNNSKQIMFGMGKNEVLSGAETINNNFLYFGLSKKVSEDWKVTGMIEYSGLNDQFSMVSTSVPVRFTQDSYFLEVIPALRTISLSTLNNKNLFVSSTALGVKAGWYIGKYFRLSGSAYSYAYSRDVSKLATFTSTRYFNEKALVLSSGLLKRSYNMEAGLDFDSFSISAGKNRSVSAIDNSNSDYIYTVFDYYLSDSWSLSLLYGEYLNTPADENNYTSVSVSHSF